MNIYGSLRFCWTQMFILQNNLEVFTNKATKSAQKFRGLTWICSRCLEKDKHILPNGGFNADAQWYKAKNHLQQIHAKTSKKFGKKQNKTTLETCAVNRASPLLEVVHPKNRQQKLGDIFFRVTLFRALSELFRG